MNDELPVPQENEVAPRTELQEITEALIQQKKMPQIVADKFRDRWSTYEKDDEPKVSEKLKKEIRVMAGEFVELNVDTKRTGLEVERALRMAYTDAMVNTAAEYNGVLASAESLTDILSYLSTNLTEEHRVEFVAGFSAWYQQQGREDIPDKDRITDSQLIELSRNLVLKSEMAHYGFIAGDLQKLKACNDFGSVQIEGIDGESYVDMFGYQELGRQLQALNSLIGGNEYDLQLQDLEGKTRHDPLKNFQKIGISESYYKDLVQNKCSQEDIQYCIDNGINILPAAKRTAGDEFTFSVKKNRLVGGKANALNEMDMQVAERLIKQVSSVDIGIFTEDDSKFKRARGQEIFQERLNIPDGKLTIGFGLRVGSHARTDTFFDQSPAVSNSQLESSDPEERFAEIINVVLDTSIGSATQQMEANKREETMDYLFYALNKNSEAQMLMILLIEQGRFPGDVNKLKELVLQYKDQEITRTDFEDKLRPLLERRTETERQGPVYLHSRSVLD